MNKVIQFIHPRRRRSEIRQQAAAWLSKIDAGAQPHELSGLGEWLSEDPAHLDAFLELARLWDQLGLLSQLSEVFPLDEYVPMPRRGRQRRALALTAAGLAGAALLGSFTLVRWKAPDGSLMRRAYSTAVGEQATITLPDGSSFILNTGSQVEVVYRDSARHVYLSEGEALFEVAADPGRPFRVFAGARVVEAVGTRFTVQRRAADELEVIVTEGTVRVQSLGSSPSPDSQDEDYAPVQAGGLSLAAGQYAAVSGALGNVVQGSLPPEEIEARLSWQHGMLLFQDEPLARVLEEVRRYTTVWIEADDDLLDIRVQGYYEVGNIESLLVAMRENFGIDALRLAEDHILLLPREERGGAPE